MSQVEDNETAGSRGQGVALKLAAFGRNVPQSMRSAWAVLLLAGGKQPYRKQETTDTVQGHLSFLD